MKFKDGLRISSRVQNNWRCDVRIVPLKKSRGGGRRGGRVTWMLEPILVPGQPSESRACLCWGEGTREIKDFFPKCERVLWLRLSSHRVPGKKYLFCILPRSISRWFRKVDESCLLSMKMNGQDFSKKQSLTKVHPSCRTGRSGKQFSCT